MDVRESNGAHDWTQFRFEDRTETEARAHMQSRTNKSVIGGEQCEHNVFVCVYVFG